MIPRDIWLLPHLMLNYQGEKEIKCRSVIYTLVISIRWPTCRGWEFHQGLWAGVILAFVCGLAAFALATCKTMTTTRNLLVVICALIAIILSAIVILLLVISFFGLLGSDSSKGGTIRRRAPEGKILSVNRGQNRKFHEKKNEIKY